MAKVVNGSANPSRLNLSREHKAALISTIDEVVEPAEDAEPSTNTTIGNAIQTWPWNRLESLGSEPLSRHNLSEDGEAVLASAGDYRSVGFIGYDAEGAAVELLESKIKEGWKGNDLCIVYYINSGY